MKRASINIVNPMRGTTPINKVMRGSVLVWERNTTPAPEPLLYNIYIGGVAASIPDAATLATKFGITAGDISYFNISGSDVQAKIDVTFSLPVDCFRDDATVTFFRELENRISLVGADAFNNTSKLKDAVFTGETDFSSQVFRDSYARVYVADSTIMTGVSFYNGMSKEIYIPNVTQLGLAANNNNVFYQNFYSKIYANPALGTSNGGAEEGDIDYARSIGCEIVYVQNFTKPSAVSNLSIGTQYATAIHLSFTAPASTNTIEHYEVFVNGELNSRGAFDNVWAVGLSPSTSYDITVKAVDIYGNTSDVSNTLTASTVTMGASPMRTANLVSFYPLDAFANSQAVDIYGGENLINNKVVGGLPGKVGNSFLSTIATSHLNTDTCTSITGDFTINTWLYRVDTPTDVNNSNIIQQGNFAQTTGFGIWINGSGNLAWRINRQYNNYSANANLPLKQWTMVTLTRTGSTIKLYLNAVEKVSATYATPPNASTKRRLFNRYENNAAFRGRQANAAFYNAGLPLADIQTFYNNGKGLPL